MSKTILIAEDNPEIRSILKMNFEDQGHSVIVAENGKQALELLEQYGPHMIISDFEMPVMNGFEFFKQARFFGNECPWLFLTGNPDGLMKLFESEDIAPPQILDKLNVSGLRAAVDILLT